LNEAFRTAARRLRRTPGQTALAVLALALGIGFTTVLFSIVHGTFWSGLPVPDSDRIMKVERRSLLEGGIRQSEMDAWLKGQDSFAALASWFATDVFFAADGVPAEGYHGACVTAPFFDVVQVAPLLGRTFGAEEDREGVPGVVVLSYRLWTERYRKDPRILGRRVRISGSEQSTIIGVMPESFRFPVDQDFWVPLGAIGSAVVRNRIPLEAVGRLRPGVSLERARQELDGLAPALPVEGEAGENERHILVRPFVLAYGESGRRPLGLMSLAGVGVLLIACANVANILLARGARRERDLAVRIAIGAQPRQITALILAESVLLSALGAAAGLWIAMAGIGLYNATGGILQASWIDIRMDGDALVFALGAALLTALLAGAVPAARAARVSPGLVLRDESPGSGSLRLGRAAKTLVVAQIALSCALLSGTWQMIESVQNLYKNDVGAEPEKLWTALVAADFQDSPYPDQWLRFFDQLLHSLRAVPGVRSAVFTSSPPATATPRSAFEVEGGVPIGIEATARWSVVSPGFFEAMGRRILDGRDFGPQDTARSAPAVIVNQSFARRFLPGRSPLGQRIRIGPGNWLTVVGVAPDLYLSLDYYSNRIAAEHREGLYLPLSQNPQPGGSLIVRTAAEPSAMAPAIRKAIAAVDPDVPPMQANTVAGLLGLNTADYRRVRAVLSVFGLASFLLAGVGLHGVVSFMAGQRRHEMAVRQALGATGTDIVALIVGGGLRQAGLGVLVGVGLALPLSRLLGGLLYGVQAGEPWSLVAAAGSLLLLAVFSCLIPALRAAATAPAVSLKGS
jgi:predicted permease